MRRRWMRRTMWRLHCALSLANEKDSVNAARRVQGNQGVHGDNPSHEDALEEHDDPKMGPVLQAAQARADTKAVIAGMRKH